MLNIVLNSPEIPPNTGNIIRLCANTGSRLHLIKPYGFNIDSSSLKRAHLDYEEFSTSYQYINFDEFLEKINPKNLFAFDSSGVTKYTEITYQKNDYLLFGTEGRGLPENILKRKEISKIIRIPMKKSSRSLNLSNAVALSLYESLRQLEFPELI
ncbi:MAG: tRNA (uridine(34)/cytosine(34)/5-carboxymethylaminomethyluridine(34)-2'-O)-methyltransferase TrmL [Chloroflexi bacterium]|nr:tRNA (uridine(34)/cytosine(34)/5-carboxymethylaminomethyluridine(34)-2'-O)-methyltransferase TrmL [Chloroflexota bacterium]|tara:strand:+ start:320 stop:784 length:465 start_codon:yes stop_codon:yes gene_type:complete